MEHPYHEGFNREIVKERRAKDPDFKTDYELEMDAKTRAEEKAAAEEVEERLYNTDWSKPQFHAKATPKQKMNNKQGKKQPLAKHIAQLQRCTRASKR